MSVVIPLLIVAIAITAIWLIIEFKRFRHKILLIFLIVLILSVYISFTVVLRDKDINLKTASGIKEGVTLYFSWLGTIFQNFKTITSNAIGLNWGVNEATTKKISNSTFFK
jgi:disulfide bond formation protein DsbB